jgi:hypothetical protein
VNDDDAISTYHAHAAAAVMCAVCSGGCHGHRVRLWRPELSPLLLLLLLRMMMMMMYPLVLPLLLLLLL